MVKLLARSMGTLLLRAAPHRSSHRHLVTATSTPTGFPDVPSFTLNDGSRHPALGFGTYKVGFVPASASASALGSEAAGATEATARECVGDALSLGYRMLDCAEFYGNEAEVGRAIVDSGVPRAELYLASKVWTSTIFRGPGAVKEQVHRTLRDLGVGRLDLCCVHWPVPGKHVEAYLALQECREEGLVASLGVSNYAVEDYEELMADPRVTVAPAVNQIEVNPFLYRRETLAFFQAKGVVVQAYRALRDGKAFAHSEVARVAAKHGRTPAQILGRWCVQRGCIYMPKSVQRARMAENAAVFDFALDAGDLASLDALTTDESLAAFLALYHKCVNRDTPLDGTLEGVKEFITVR